MKLEALNHVGVRVRDLRRSAEWYAHLGFRLIWQSEQHKVACLRNDEIGVELNLIFNSDDSSGGRNVLMDVEPKYPGFNHLSFRVSSIQDTINALKVAGIDIKASVPGYQKLPTTMARRIAGGMTNRTELANAVGQPEILVEHVLRLLQNDDHIRTVGSNAGVDVFDVKPKLKRLFGGS